MANIEGKYISAVNLARKNLNIAVDELVDAWNSSPDDDEAPPPAPKPSEELDTAQLVTIASGGKSPPAEPKTPPPESEDDTDAMVASLTDEQSLPAQVKTAPPATKPMGEFDLDAILAEIAAESVG